MPHREELDNCEVLAVHQLNIAFQEERQFIPAVQNLSFSLRRGETLAIVGESGSGKSVTALALMRLLEQTGGQVTSERMLLRRRNRQVIDLNELSASQMQGVRGADIAMIFQEPMTSLNPVFPVGEQIAESIRLHQGLSGDEALNEAKRMLELVRIPEAHAILSRYPHQLSGGQRQRVALARSLAKRPKLLLLDEPMGALDKKLRDRMQLEVVDILERVGVTCVMVTHDQEEAMTMAGRIAIMNRGKFVQIGEPEEIYEHPTTRYSAEFIGSVNVFEGLLKERQEDGLVIESPGLVHPLKVDSDNSVVDNVPVYVALRPEKIMLCDEPPADGYNFAVGEVVHIAYLGDLSIYHVRLKSGQMLSAQLQNEHRYRKGQPTWGDEVSLCWDADSCVVLTV